MTTSITIKNMNDYEGLKKVIDYPDDFTGIFELWDTHSIIHFIQGMAVISEVYYNQYHTLIDLGYPETTAYKLAVDYNSARIKNWTFARVKNKAINKLTSMYNPRHLRE